MLEMLLPILIKYVIIPEVGRIIRAEPGLTDEQIIAKLPADINALVTTNQAALDSLRAAAGRT